MLGLQKQKFTVFDDLNIVTYKVFALIIMLLFTHGDTESNPGPKRRTSNYFSSEVTFMSCNYKLPWLKIVLNGEMQSNHPGMLQTPTFVDVEKKDNKLDSKYVVTGI